LINLPRFVAKITHVVAKNRLLGGLTLVPWV
jgi:hypothetical protein